MRFFQLFIILSEVYQNENKEWVNNQTIREALAQLTKDESLEEAKYNKPSPIIDAFVIELLME